VLLPHCGSFEGELPSEVVKMPHFPEATLDQESFAAFLASRPDDDISKYELIGGKVFVSPPSSWPYGEAELNVGRILADHVTGLHLGRVCGPSQGYDLPGGHTLAP